MKTLFSSMLAIIKSLRQMSNKISGLFNKDNCPIPMSITQNRQRLDLTEWVIHFVHDRKPDNDTVGLYEDYLLFKDEISGTQN